MDNLYRLQYALKCEGKTALAFDRVRWNSLVAHDGEVTILSDAPDPIAGVQRNAIVVAIVASGVVNPDPGIDVVRRDDQDYPYVYNLDHYQVIENLQGHAQFPQILERARLADTEELRQELSRHVFLVGPYNTEHPEHWAQELPGCVLRAKSRHEDSS